MKIGDVYYSPRKHAYVEVREEVDCVVSDGLDRRIVPGREWTMLETNGSGVSYGSSTVSQLVEMLKTDGYSLVRDAGERDEIRHQMRRFGAEVRS